MFLLSYLYRFDADSLTEEDVQPIAEALLRLFAIIEVGNVGFSASIFKTFLFNENFKLVDPQVQIEDIIDDFNSHITKNWKQDTIKEDLMEYNKNILVFLNEYLYAKEQNRMFDFAENVNIEHIMPASGRNIETIRIDAGIATKEEFNELVNLLGNKILLEEDINKRIGNDWFKTKKGSTIESRCGYRNSKFGMALDLVKYHSDTWGEADINAFTKNATERISDFIFGK